MFSPLAMVSATPEIKITNESKLAINGIGPIRVGMTIDQAIKSSGMQLVSASDTGTGTDCRYVNLKGGPSDLAFMVTEGRIARVDVLKNSRITTLSGAQIGDTEAQIKALYPGQIQVTPHKYISGGHYLTFVPKDLEDKNYRVVFETDGQHVTQFRAGKLPEVNYVEGCA